jgi:hypothetical protein
MEPTEFERAIIAMFRDQLTTDPLLEKPLTDHDILDAARTVDFTSYQTFLRAIAYRMPAACGELAQQWLLEVSHG